MIMSRDEIEVPKELREFMPDKAGGELAGYAFAGAPPGYDAGSLSP